MKSKNFLKTQIFESSEGVKGKREEGMTQGQMLVNIYIQGVVQGKEPGKKFTELFKSKTGVLKTRV